MSQRDAGRGDPGLRIGTRARGLRLGGGWSGSEPGEGLLKVEFEVFALYDCVEKAVLEEEF